jgi:hypothetical protein
MEDGLTLRLDWYSMLQLLWSLALIGRATGVPHQTVKLGIRRTITVTDVRS